MFQLWRLVLLCGLLTGTSASLLQDLGNDLTSVVKSVKPVLDRGIDTVDHALEAVLGKLKVDLGVLQDTKVWQVTKQKFLEAENLVNDALSKIFSSRDKALGLKISNAHIVDIKAELSTDGQGLNLRLPVTADVDVILPLIGQTVKLKASLDLMAGVGIEIDPQTGNPTVVVSECASDPASISFSLLGRHSALVNNLADSVSSLLSKTVSFLVQKQICPLVRIFTSSVDVEFVQNIIDKLQQGINVQIHS